MKNWILLILIVFNTNLASAGPKENLIGYYKMDLVEGRNNAKKISAALPEDQKIRAENRIVIDLGYAVCQVTENLFIQHLIKADIQKSYDIIKENGNTITIRQEEGDIDILVEDKKITFNLDGSKVILIKIPEEEALAKIEIIKKIKSNEGTTEISSNLKNLYGYYKINLPEQKIASEKFLENLADNKKEEFKRRLKDLNENFVLQITETNIIAYSLEKEEANSYDVIKDVGDTLDLKINNTTLNLKLSNAKLEITTPEMTVLLVKVLNTEAVNKIEEIKKLRKK